MKPTDRLVHASALTLSLAAAAPAAATNADGFKAIFDGKTFDGWKAPDMSYWSVEDGAITGTITEKHPLKVNQYLVWQGGELADFELRLKSRVTGSKGTNSGFQFRSKLLPNNDIAGYQVDNNLDTDWLVRLYDEHGRETLAMRGTRAVLEENGKVTTALIPGASGPADFRLEEWHEYHLVAQGPHFTLKVNGRLVAEVIDNDPRQRDLSGVLGLQLHSGPPATIQFRDIWLKALRPTTRADGTREVSSAQGEGLAAIIDQKVLCRKKYIGWPSIAKAPNGDLIAAFSGDRSGHISPDGKIQIVRSHDGGKTWSGPTTIRDLPIDDRDTGIIRTKKGTMLVSWFTGPPYGTELQGHYVIRSSDNGYTWGQAIRTPVTTPHGPIQLSDGRLLFLGQRPHCSHVAPKDYNGQPAQSPYKVSVAESLDDGLTWAVIADFPIPQDARMLSFDEAHVVEAEPGKLVALFRDCNPPDRLRQSESTDGGRTWSPPHSTPIQGHPPHVIRLTNGWLLVVYARRRPPFGEYACISKDRGKTWETRDEIKLAGAFDADIGYPASVELADGTIWTVYYQAERPGEPPCLMGTHWRLKRPAPTTDAAEPPVKARGAGEIPR